MAPGEPLTGTVTTAAITYGKDWAWRIRHHALYLPKRKMTRTAFAGPGFLLSDLPLAGLISEACVEILRQGGNYSALDEV